MKLLLLLVLLAAATRAAPAVVALPAAPTSVQATVLAAGETTILHAPLPAFDYEGDFYLATVSADNVQLFATVDAALLQAAPHMWPLRSVQPVATHTLTLAGDSLQGGVYIAVSALADTSFTLAISAVYEGDPAQLDSTPNTVAGVLTGAPTETFLTFATTAAVDGAYTLTVDGSGGESILFASVGVPQDELSPESWPLSVHAQAGEVATLTLPGASAGDVLYFALLPEALQPFTAVLRSTAGGDAVSLSLGGGLQHTTLTAPLAAHTDWLGAALQPADAAVRARYYLLHLPSAGEWQVKAAASSADSASACTTVSLAATGRADVLFGADDWPLATAIAGTLGSSLLLQSAGAATAFVRLQAATATAAHCAFTLSATALPPQQPPLAVTTLPASLAGELTLSRLSRLSISLPPPAAAAGDDAFYAVTVSAVGDGAVQFFTAADSDASASLSSDWLPRTAVQPGTPHVHYVRVPPTASSAALLHVGVYAPFGGQYRLTASLLPVTAGDGDYERVQAALAAQAAQEQAEHDDDDDDDDDDHQQQEEEEEEEEGEGKQGNTDLVAPLSLSEQQHSGVGFVEYIVTLPTAAFYRIAVSSSCGARLALAGTLTDLAGLQPSGWPLQSPAAVNGSSMLVESDGGRELSPAVFASAACNFSLALAAESTPRLDATEAVFGAALAGDAAFFRLPVTQGDVVSLLLTANDAGGAVILRAAMQQGSTVPTSMAEWPAGAPQSQPSTAGTQSALVYTAPSSGTLLIAVSYGSLRNSAYALHVYPGTQLTPVAAPLSQGDVCASFTGVRVLLVQLPATSSAATWFVQSQGLQLFSSHGSATDHAQLQAPLLSPVAARSFYVHSAASTPSVLHLATDCSTAVSFGGVRGTLTVTAGDALPAVGSMADETTAFIAGSGHAAAAGLTSTGDATQLLVIPTGAASASSARPRLDVQGDVSVAGRVPLAAVAIDEPQGASFIASVSAVSSYIMRGAALHVFPQSVPASVRTTLQPASVRAFSVDLRSAVTGDFDVSVVPDGGDRDSVPAALFVSADSAALHSSLNDWPHAVAYADAVAGVRVTLSAQASLIVAVAGLAHATVAVNIRRNTIFSPLGSLPARTVAGGSGSTHVALYSIALPAAGTYVISTEGELWLTLSQEESASLSPSQWAAEGIGQQPRTVCSAANRCQQAGVIATVVKGGQLFIAVRTDGPTALSIARQTSSGDAGGKGQQHRTADGLTPLGKAAISVVAIGFIAIVAFAVLRKRRSRAHSSSTGSDAALLREDLSSRSSYVELA